jgi:ABC-type sugar transport system permease subunit
MNSVLASQKKVRRSAISIWISAVVRTIIFTVTCTGLGMAIGLFTGILVQVARSLVHRGAIDMTVAYRYFGFPLAAVGGIGALVIFSLIETRTARRLLAGR